MMANLELKKDYLLALKVMRLTNPTLVNPQIITSESKDMCGSKFSEQLENDLTTVRGSETLASGQFMLMPQSFGNIYLGETFSSYICVHNCTPYAVQNVVVKADLQSDKLKISLPIHANRTTPITLQPDGTMDDIIHHEVKEIGVHILVCEVQYTSPNDVHEVFRKFFKFQVFKPLDVKTKYYNDDTDDVYLEAQIQNITAGTICLESVELECMPEYVAQSLNTLPNGESVFKSKNMLEPLNSCQFLYCIRPQLSIAGDFRALRAANNYGKLDIIWRSNLGERGRLQTSQLQRSAHDYKDLRLTVLEAKSTVRIGEPYTIRCRLTNSSERSMVLQLTLNTLAKLGFGYTGQSELMLGTIEADKHIDFPLTVVPVRIGLISIGRLQLTDVFIKQTYSFNDFVQVYVVDEKFRNEELLEMDKYVQYRMEKTTPNNNTVAIVQ